MKELQNKMHISFLLLLIIALIFNHGKVLAVTRYYELNITSVRHNPDCSDHLSSVLMINNQLPGPLISLNKGDTVQVIVRNNILPDLPVNGGVGPKASIHFHGIRQINSSNSDGVPFLTQRPIEPGESFTHLFNVPNQVGTFFYHAHVGLEEMSVFGPLIVYDSDKSNPVVMKEELQDGPFTYDDERIISLSEWWHVDRGQFEAYYLGPNFTQIFEPQTFLINGNGIFDTSIDLDTNCKGYEIIPVSANRTYRIRIIGAMTFRTLGFAIAGHQMTVIEVDGDYVKPYDVDYLEVSAGQRFSVLITTNQTSGDYGIHVVRKWAAGIPTETNGYATLRYQEEKFIPWSYDEVDDQPIGSRTLSKAALQPEFPVNDTVHWFWNNIEPYYGVEPQALGNDSRVIKLRGSQNIIDGLTRWYINDVSFMDDFNKVILYDVVNTTRALPKVTDRHVTGYNPHLNTYPLNHLEIVDIVIQTTHREGEPCRSHPWHTHGHSHWEIAYGSGEYTEERDGMIRNVPNPVFKDLTLVYPGKSEKIDGDPEIGCGWSKIRMVADNPGIWAMHCHNSPHMYMGMMLAFEESPELISERLFL